MLVIKLAVEGFCVNLLGRTFSYRQIIVLYNGWTTSEKGMLGLQDGAYSFSHFSLLLNIVQAVTMLIPILCHG